MDNNQDDVYAARRAELEAQFQALPPTGSSDYWRRIEESDAARRLPLEVLARCYRERYAARITDDANRIFQVIVERIGIRVTRWAGSIARQAKSGMKPQLQQEMEQECYMKLWEDLAGDGPTFLLESFSHKLEYICDHVAQSQMIKAGEWKRSGVEKPKRIPRGEMESIEAEPVGEGELPLAAQLVSTSAQDELQRVDYSDLVADIEKLSREDRTIIYGLFFQDRTQEEIAAELGVTARTIRNRLQRILHELREFYEGNKGGDNV